MIGVQVTAYKNYIDGQWVDSSDGNVFHSMNPADREDIVGCFQASTAEDAIRAIRAAEKTFPAWAKTSPSKRAAILNQAADILESRCEEIAHELTREEGKVLSASRLEVKRSAATLRYYAVEGLSFSGETFANDDPASMVFTVREPLGVIAVITPWNFPLSIPARKIAPALMTGNTVVFKPASETPLMGLRLTEALADAGIPAGVFNFITGSAAKVGTPLVTDAAIRGITFTGSTQAGEAIHRQVSLTTRMQMELGGKNPILVMEDADLDKAVELTIKGGFELTGQACTGTSRVIVMRNVHDEFVAKLVDQTSRLKIGNGFAEGVQVGPLANQSQLDTVLEYVAIGREEGANLVYGGDRLTENEYGKGYYVKPAIFTGVASHMRIAQEEIFGPVIAVIAVDSFNDALQVANGVAYGLSASIVTKDLEKAQTFVKEIQSGTVKVNRTTTGNLMHAPFGGLKKSSTSTFRESGRVGLEFFTQTKTVYFGY
ncbi:aldehyde dehydrogenase family protein [Fodinisporobacter ferrooxydans]|uniref:Aldehyde dehydrogenase family protein n=1 Tax=Fodinisporobacter ferrooxydans TaxID=2901836 RepID=A0ABY4CMG7_9BACL|nr:aldehyde dehydrogenase family protein [Alicyclobacillaceae bacterium MYW30-H2]